MQAALGFVILLAFFLATPFAFGQTTNFRTGRGSSRQLDTPSLEEETVVQSSRGSLQLVDSAPWEEEPAVKPPLVLPQVEEPFPWEEESAVNPEPVLPQAEEPLPGEEEVVAQPLPSSFQPEAVSALEEEAVPQLSSVPSPPELAVPVEVETTLRTVLLDDLLARVAEFQGKWIWEEDPEGANKFHGHSAAAGLQSHGLTFLEPVLFLHYGLLSQQVWLDPSNPPQGISIRFKVAGGEEVGVYWEGEEEVFLPVEEHAEIWYYGILPEFGQWVTLSIFVEDMALEEAPIEAIRFVTFGGRVLWDQTVLTVAPPFEESSQESSSFYHSPSS